MKTKYEKAIIEICFFDDDVILASGGNPVIEPGTSEGGIFQ